MSRLRKAETGWALALATLASAGCLNLSVQRWPGPMRAEEQPLPPGDSQLHPPGPEEATVVRHADPVRVRPSGQNSSRPLRFYDKQARLSAGSQVVVAPGGRAEVLWPEGSALILFGNAVGWIGSPSRGEELFDLRQVERARIMLEGEDRVRLVGGPVLSGPGGPYLLSYETDGTLAVHNQSKGSAEVAFRDERFELGPGQRVILPILSGGGADGRPFESPEGLRRFTGPSFNVEATGDVTPSVLGGGFTVEAGGESEVSALGVRVRLGPGGRATFRDPAGEAEEPPTPPAPARAAPESQLEPAETEGAPVPVEPEPVDAEPREADPSAESGQEAKGAVRSGEPQDPSSPRGGGR